MPELLNMLTSQKTFLFRQDAFDIDMATVSLAIELGKLSYIFVRSQGCASIY